MATVTNGVSTYTPDLVIGLELDSTARSVEHQILGESSVYTVRSTGPGAGTLRFLFVTLAAAQAVLAAHRLPAVWSLNMSPEAVFTLSYVVAPGGQVGLSAATEQGTKWTVTVDYKERT